VRPLGSVRRRRGSKEEQAPGAPAWMATYGDLITNILIFFVLLFSMSNIENNKFDMALLSLQGSLGVIDGGRTLYEEEFVEAGEVGSFLISAEEQREFERLEEKVKDIVELNEITGVETNMDERGLVIRFVDGVLFDSGKANIKESAVSILNKIAPEVKESHRHVRIEGHTDNLPIKTQSFPSNWELSTARAVNVVKFMIENHNFSPYILSAAGYGEYRPVAPNDSAKHRALNRRVDIIILKSAQEAEEPK